jgi:hypothetical protein
LTRNGTVDERGDEAPAAPMSEGGGVEPRSVRPYIVALGLLWGLPVVLVLVLHLTLPDHNASGQCTGLGFGCTPAPSDAVLLLGYLAALPLFLLGMGACLVIALVRARRDRHGARRDEVAPSVSRDGDAAQG